MSHGVGVGNSEVRRGMKADRDAGEARLPDRWRRPLMAFGAFLALSLAWAIASSRRADSEHRLCLDAFTPLVQGVVALGMRLEQHTIPIVTRAGQAISILLVLVAAAGLTWRRAKGLKPALLLVALALAAYAQSLLLQGKATPGVRIYIAALFCAAVAQVLPKRLGSLAADGTSTSPDKMPSARPSVLEIVALAFVTTAALVYRFYALNQIPNDFDGEAAYFMACSTSLRGIALVNAGVANGPWSPFGWLYYIPVHLATEIFGSHLLSIRFVSAVTGVVSVPLFWALLRRLAGAVEALLGSVLLCFALTDMFWSRTDIFPYHAPGLIAIALAWCSYEAIVTERLGYFVLAAFFMAVSYHQFPSGQTLFLIPLGSIGIHALLDRGYRKRCWKKALILLVGAALWYGGQSLNLFLATGRLQKASPFALNPGKTLWSLPLEAPGLASRAEFIARKAGKNAADVVRSQFLEIVLGQYPHHEAIPSLTGLRVREISAAAAVLLALGAVLLLLRPRSPGSQVILVWILAALLPGLLSTTASAHRIAAVFPAFLAAAAIAGGDVVRGLRSLLGRAGSALAAVGGAALFEGLLVVAATLCLQKAWASTPPTVAISEVIRPYLTGGSLAVFDVDNGDYLSSELTYIFMDDFSRVGRPPLWRISRDSNWPEIAYHPAPGFDDWYYTQTRLRDRRAALMAEPPPKRVIFLVQDMPERKSHADILTQLYPRVPPRRLVVSGLPRHYNLLAFVVEERDLREASSPLVTVGAGGGVTPGPGGWWEGRDVRMARAAPAEGATISAGLWVRGQRLSGFRSPGAGEGGSVLLDGERLDASAVRPITRGVHRIDIRLGKSPRLPLSVEESTEGGPFHPFPNEDILAPEVASRSVFAPETVLPYQGYDAPVPVAALDGQFLASLAVSPSGELGVLWAYESHWKVALYPPGGKEVTWDVPRPAERSEYSRLAFAAERIALLNSPNLILLDRGGRVLFKKDLRPKIEGAHDLGANEAGELFLASTPPGGVHVFSPEGQPMTTLRYPEFGPNWAPDRISVPFRGPVAVFDRAGKIRVFERVSPLEWRMARTQPGLYSLDSRRFQVREDGWLFARVLDRSEFLTFDRALNRRIAQNPAHDLSIFDTGSQLLGFDRSGNLYIYRDGDGRVWRLPKRAG